MSDRDRSSPTLIETTGLKSLLGRDNYPLIGGANGECRFYLIFLDVIFRRVLRRSDKVRDGSGEF